MSLPIEFENKSKSDIQKHSGDNAEIFYLKGLVLREEAFCIF